MSNPNELDELITGTFLKPIEIDKDLGSLIVIMGEGEIKESKFTKKVKDKDGKEIEIHVKQLNLPIQLNERDRIWTPNKTTIENIANILGKDRSKWIGKKILARIESQLIGKQKKDVVYGEVVEDNYRIIKSD